MRAETSNFGSSFHFILEFQHVCLFDDEAGATLLENRLSAGQRKCYLLTIGRQLLFLDSSARSLCGICVRWGRRDDTDCSQG